MAATSEAPSTLATRKTQGAMAVSPEGGSSVTWDMGGDVRIVSYPGGNRDYHPTGPRLGDIKDVDARIRAIATLDSSKYTGFAIVDGYKALDQSAGQRMHLLIEHQLQKPLLSFNRFPSAEGIADLSTPFDTQRNYRLVKRLKLIFSPMALHPDGQKVMQSHMLRYFKACASSERMSSWSALTMEFFRRYDYRESDNAYELFSQLACFIAGRSVLGVEGDDFQHFSSIWNALFAPPPEERDDKSVLESVGDFFTSAGQKMQQGIAKFYSYDMGLYPCLVERVKEACRSRSYTREATSFFDYCLANGVAEKILMALPQDLKDTARARAEKDGLTLSQKVMVDMAVSILIGMQENYAFTMAEACRRLGRDSVLQQLVRSNKEQLDYFIGEILRWIPPAGHNRQLRWDTEVSFKSDDGATVTHQMRAGDLIGIHPSIFARSPKVYDHPERFAPSRAHKTKHCPFGHGPHRCPGEPVARPWLRETLGTILENFSIESAGKGGSAGPQRFLVAFTMKHEPPVDVKLKALEAEASSSSTSYQ